MTAKPKTGTAAKPKNKGGRPKGAIEQRAFRTKMNAKYLRELFRHWEANGTKAIDRVFQEDPAKYVAFMASLIPKQTEAQFEDVTEKPAIGTVDLANQLAAILTSGEIQAALGNGDGVSQDMDTDTGATDGSVLH